jgi:hypothetical protein
MAYDLHLCCFRNMCMLVNPLELIHCDSQKNLFKVTYFVLMSQHGKDV